MTEAKAIFAEDASIAGIAGYIQQRLASPGEKTVAVPGGSTPPPIFAELAHRPINWGKVTLTLGDDRCVPEDHPASNFGALKTALAGLDVTITPLKEGQHWPNIALNWIGMGTDGHIASLFPNTDPKMDAPRMVTRLTPDPLPPEAPFDRLTMTLPMIAASDQVMLVIKGPEKRAVFDAALAGESDLPIARLIAGLSRPIMVFWSE